MKYPVPEEAPLKTALKWILVLGGYAAAPAGAALVVYLHQIYFPLPPDVASSGMAAGGDMIFFIAVWAFLSLFPSALALFFLRSRPGFWNFFAWLGLGLAATAPLAEVLNILNRLLQVRSAFWALAGFIALLRVGLAPLMALLFLAAGWMATPQKPRWILWAAAGIELSVFACEMFCIFFRTFLHF
jgi:hypothetical protein